MRITSFVDKLLSPDNPKNNFVTFKEASLELGLDKEKLEELMQVLEEEGFVSTKYPLIFSGKSGYKIIKSPTFAQEEKPKSDKLIEKYEIQDKEELLKTEVTIYEKDDEKCYFVSAPSMSDATRAYIEHLKDKISYELPNESSSLSLTERTEIMRKIIKQSCFKYLSGLETDEVSKNNLYGIIKNEMIGTGELEFLLADQKLEEIVVNKSNSPVYVYHRIHGWLKTNIVFKSEERTRNYSSRIARAAGRQYALLTPLLDASLPSGERVNATLHPISDFGNTITLRKFKEEPFTITYLIENKTLTPKMASFLWTAIQYELNVLVVGGTASGKTTMLNSLLMLINPYQRIITIEDTREINLTDIYENWVPLVSRPKNPEGLGEVRVLDLMINSLRMRPDRIIVGEVRKKEEVRVMMEAMHTGHSVYSTFHADTSHVAVKRLIEDPISISLSELEILDLIVTQRRNRRTHQRRTFEISSLKIRGKDQFETQQSFRHKARTDTFVEEGIDTGLIEKIGFHTGMVEQEITQELELKEKVIKQLIKKKIFDIKPLTALMKTYYSDQNKFYKKIGLKV